MRPSYALLILLVLGAAAALCPVRLAAQQTTHRPGQIIAGLVLDARTGEPLEGADVVAENVRGELADRTISDETGRFFLAVDGPGLYSLRLIRIGYDSTTAVQVAAARDQNLFVEIRANPLAVDLDPITVTAPQVVPYLDATGFYARERRGQGSFLGPKDMDRLYGANPTHALRRIAGVNVIQGQITMRGSADGFGSACHPVIYLDGMSLRDTHIDDIVPLNQIEAIEVYRGAATVPAQWRANGVCGVIAVWTKH